MHKRFLHHIRLVLLLVTLAFFSPFLMPEVHAGDLMDGNPENRIKPTIQLSATTFTYTGEECYPQVEVFDEAGNLIDPSNYEVKYPAASRMVGRYVVSVTMTEGTYPESFQKNYKIVPQPAEIVHVTTANKGFHIKWKKNTETVTGYQIGYAQKPDFSDMKTRNFTGENKTLGIITKLHGHATYYAKVRRYYKVGGETFCSPWTDVEEIYTRNYNDNYRDLKAAESISGFQYLNTDKKLSSATKKSLDQAVNAITKKGYRLSFVLMDLDTGEGLTRNIDQVFNAASTIKGPYVCAITSQMPDKARKYRSSITKTIVNSDNYCYTSLRSIFGSEPLRAYMKEAHTSIPLSTWTRYSPRKLSMLWIRNWWFFQSGTEDAEWTKKTFDHSYMAFINEQLASSKVKVYSKPGWLYSGGPVAQHDAGIVEKDNGHTYLLTVLSNAYGQKPLLRSLVAELDKCEEELQKK
ncbi:MAG: class A beta-lactamase-related serine hydrolase [Dorea sp.]|nr:class A beta-lactamase-related serine hydrolase [Dorea sp.]